jgi:cytosine/adenosine deaminase-related metal-dependent hydrolase
LTTLIEGGWIIGFNGFEHRLIRDGVVVFKEDTILHVGKSYTGRIDERIDARGKIVSPGFVNTHFHATTPISSEAYMIDTDQRLAFGNPNIPVAPIHEKLGHRKLTEEKFKAVALFTLCALLKSGCTTIVEMGAGSKSLVDLVGKIGVRAYMGPGYRSAETYTGDDGILYMKDWNEERGLKGLMAAKEFFEKYDNAHNGRVKSILIPLQADNCTPKLLKETRILANEIGARIATHVSQRIYEFHEIIRRHGNTPIGFLNDVGLLGPDVLVGHALYVSGHYGTAFPGNQDIDILGKTGTSVATCPLVSARTSWALDSFNRYLNAGVNMTIGTDTWPLDIISEMRWASIIGKIVEQNRSSATSAEVFKAATLGASRALGRNDIGRLVKGAKADIVIINTSSFRYAPIADPIKSLINAGNCDDIETVIIAGKKVVDAKRIERIDEDAVKKETIKITQELWNKIPETDWARRGIYDIGSMSYKTWEEP